MPHASSKPINDDAEWLELGKIKKKGGAAWAAPSRVRRPRQRPLGSVHESRYCAMGQRCLGYDHQTGSPQKLRRTSKSDLCEFCQQAQSKGVLATVDGLQERAYSSDKDAELKAYKRALGVENLTLLKSSVVAERYRLEENLPGLCT
jgi:hypothetical protein